MRIETDRLIIRSVERGDELVYADMAKDGSLFIVLRNLLRQLGKKMLHHGKLLKRLLFNWLKEKCIKILTMLKKNCIVFIELRDNSLI